MLLTDESIWLLFGKIRDDEPPREFQLLNFPFRVGRRADLPCYLPFPTVSNVHAELDMEGDHLVVRDLESTNGTFVNGDRVQGSRALEIGDLVQFANVVLRVNQRSPRETGGTLASTDYDRALALIQFDRLMSERAVIPFFQPIVNTETEQAIGYEIVGRSHFYGLTMPAAMFRAAEQLNLESELSRLCRWAGLAASRAVEKMPCIFLNTHPAELDDLAVLELSLQELRDDYRDQSIVLEIHEAAITNIPNIRRLRDFLKELNIGIAYDDFGAGQSRLKDLIEVPPNYLKFDIGIVGDLESASAEHLTLIGSLVEATRRMGITPVAEGIETEGNAKRARALGLKIQQGFFYGHPAPVEHYVNKPAAEDFCSASDTS